MKYYFGFFFLISTCFFFACQSTRSEPPILDRQQYTFTGANRCDTTRNTGVNVEVSYFLLKADTKGAQKINDSLQTLAAGSVVSWLDSATVAINPDTHKDLTKAANLFAADYESVRKDMGHLGGCWELKTTADTVHAGPKTLTVKFDTYAYTGGAHPNSNLSFYTFDLDSGRMLTLADMVTDTTSLLGVVEKAFRKQQELSPHTNLEEQGYFLRDGHFFLPANVGLSMEGLVFYYNPYEIAAYAVGPIQVTVPYAQLTGILRSDWL
ncbi:DUF3298 and DUF4163 domain-containing protein [Spirosoma validum]|uniref:DUF3298 domain-containing protein n=1 Tax=Spirosoma validum TaxID=2771355 RepID=A0A927AZU4_9BACT|nr:DUF3298 and DUF4163 domain-containing protein [Spirosoma validum]MBD2752899.1 DUF3298 domain-containing protein [Spirosoma validum]